MKSAGISKKSREVKVCAKWQGKKQVPCINLQGVYLFENGFDIGEKVRIDVFTDEIRIKRISPEVILRAMIAKNPSLGKLVAEFDCVACE